MTPPATVGTIPTASASPQHCASSVAPSPTRAHFPPDHLATDGLQVLIDESWRGRRWVVETDIANCFEAIPVDKLMQAVEERVCDQSVLKLLRAILRAGVMQDGRSAGR